MPDNLPAENSSEKNKFLSAKDDKVVINISRQTLISAVPAFIIILVLAIAVSFFFFGKNSGKNTPAGNKSAATAVAGSSSTTSAAAQAILDEVNPPQGYTIDDTYGNIGPQLLSAGAIDLNKFEKIYQDAGQPLTQDEIKILTQGSDEKITINAQNSYFLLNLLWALGLTNKNAILDSGPMMQSGKSQIGNFASTGGWTLGTKAATDLYSNSQIITLTASQQKILEDFADNSYRPCCDNPTAFPDCNHGMAALGLGEIMASQGATADQIFAAFKYFNAFWFPQTYFDIATYFQATKGQSWDQVDARTIAAKNYSSASGWQNIHQWLSSNGYLQQIPSSGGSCGV